MSKKAKYVFRRLSDDKRITRTLTYAQFEKCRLFGTRFKLNNGDEATLIESKFDKRVNVSAKKPPPRKHSAWASPMRSMAMGCHRLQVKAFNEKAKELQTGAHYEEDGTCVLATRGVRKKEMAVRGIFDTDACFGDKSPDNAPANYEEPKFVKPMFTQGKYAAYDRNGEMTIEDEPSIFDDG